MIATFDSLTTILLLWPQTSSLNMSRVERVKEEGGISGFAFDCEVNSNPGFECRRRLHALQWYKCMVTLKIGFFCFVASQQRARSAGLHPLKEITEIRK